MPYQFATAYPTEDGFVVEAPQGANVGQSFVRDGESWEIVRVFSLGYVVSSPNASLWPTPNVDYELV